MTRKMLALAALLCGCATVQAQTAPADIRIDGSRVHPESIAADAAGNIYVGSIGGTIYRAPAGSTVAEPWVVPSEANGLTSLFGVLADDNAGILWVCNNPGFGGPPQPGAKSGIKGIDIVNGELLKSYDFPGDGPAACNDITIMGVADLYISDTAGGRILHLAPGASELDVFAEGPELVGIDGIAISEDGAMIINNVRQNLVQRVYIGLGKYAGLETLELSEPVNGPDGLRLVSGNRFLQAEGPGNRVTYVDIDLDGNSATITPIRTGLDSSPGVTHFGGVGYATEGKIGYLFDPALRDKDPGEFVIRAFALP